MRNPVGVAAHMDRLSTGDPYSSVAVHLPTPQPIPLDLSVGFQDVSVTCTRSRTAGTMAHRDLCDLCDLRD
jgi:hypothetical protein